MIHIKKTNNKSGFIRRGRILVTCILAVMCLPNSIWGQEIVTQDSITVSYTYKDKKNTVLIINGKKKAIYFFQDKKKYDLLDNKTKQVLIQEKSNLLFTAGQAQGYLRIDYNSEPKHNLRFEQKPDKITYYVYNHKDKGKTVLYVDGPFYIFINNDVKEKITEPSVVSASEHPKDIETSAISKEDITQTAEYESIKKKADDNFKQKKWSEARGEYNTLLKLLENINDETHKSIIKDKITFCYNIEMADLNFNNSDMKKAKGLYEQLLSADIDIEIQNYIKKQIEKCSKTESKPKVSVPNLPVSDNKQKIDEFENRLERLRTECNPLLQKPKITLEDSTHLSKKQKECIALKKKAEEIKTKTTAKEEDERLGSIIGQLDKLSDNIASKLFPYYDVLSNYFKKLIGYEQDTTDLGLIKKEIADKKYESDWYNWYGKWNILDNLNNIKNRANREEKCKEFTDYVLTKYSGQEELINIIMERYSIEKDIESQITILEGPYFRIPIVKLSVVGLMILILIIFGVILLYMMIHNKKKEKEKIKKEEEQIEKLGKITFKKIEETDSNQPQSNETGTAEDGIAPNKPEKTKIKQLLRKYEYGLSDVKANVERHYKEINMFELLDDTSIHKVYLSRDFIRELYVFFSEFLKSDGKVPETGCHIIGRWDYAQNNQNAYDISLEYLVKPGSDARYSEFECDFGIEIGTSLVMDNRKYSEQFNAEYVHTSWMHSHPGLQLFLSKQDLIVQTTLTNNSPYKRMLAIVIDTKTEHLKMAFFTPKASEQQTMNNDKDIKKTLTLDELLKWAKTPYIEPKKEQEVNVKTASKKYFDIAGNNINFKITREVSVDMITVNEGTLIGKYENEQIFIDELLNLSADNQSKTSNSIGVFKEISSFENNEEWEKQKQNLLSDSFWKSGKVLVIYCLQDENLYFFTKKPDETDLETQKLSKIAIVTPFQELKKWTRERN